MKAQYHGNQEAGFLEARGESVSKPAEPLGSDGDQGGCPTSKEGPSPHVPAANRARSYEHYIHASDFL